MSEPPTDERPESGAAGHRATAELEARIARARGQRSAAAGAEQTRQGDMSGMSRGLRLASEFVAAILVGAGLGWIIDSILPTRPWGIIILLLLGFVAGVLNVTRAAREMNKANPPPADAPVVRDDDDE
jgi:ATP synthase protein I